jgi:hypothetical protein
VEHGGQAGGAMWWRGAAASSGGSGGCAKLGVEPVWGRWRRPSPIIERGRGGLPPRPWVIGGQGRRGWAARGGEGAGGWMTSEFESESEERGRGGR